MRTNWDLFGAHMPRTVEIRARTTEFAQLHWSHGVSLALPGRAVPQLNSIYLVPLQEPRTAWHAPREHTRDTGVSGNLGASRQQITTPK